MQEKENQTKADGLEAVITSTATALVSRNIRIHDRRTSVRLERQMWSALKEIAQMENCTIHDLCAAVHDTKEKGISFTAALRVFLMTYYRTAALAGRQISIVQQRLRNQNTNGQAYNGSYDAASRIREAIRG